MTDQHSVISNEMVEKARQAANGCADPDQEFVTGAMIRGALIAVLPDIFEAVANVADAKAKIAASVTVTPPVMNMAALGWSYGCEEVAAAIRALK